MKWLYYLENDEDDVILLKTAMRKAGGGDCISWYRTSADLKFALQSMASPELPKVILLDLKLDAESGLDVAAWLGDQPSLRHIPAFIFSSGRFIHEIVDALERHATGYLFKPSRFEEWIEIARQLKDMTEGRSGDRLIISSRAEAARVI